MPELLTFFHVPRHLWRKLHTTSFIECCVVEGELGTRPMDVFTNVRIIDCTVFANFSRFNEDCQSTALALLTQAA